MEAEYIVACKAAKEVIWLKKFLANLSVIKILHSPITLFCDNSGAVAQSKKPRNHRKWKHIECKYHLISEIVFQGETIVAKIPSVENLAGPFTMTLPHRIFNLTWKEWESNICLTRIESKWEFVEDYALNPNDFISMMTFNVCNEYIYVCVWCPYGLSP